MAPTPRPLGSTYRLQLPGLGFEGAAAAVPYLERLGIETLYVSPVLQAAPGSTHGYDVVDVERLDPELGGEQGYRLLLEALERHGLRLLLDIVPNHMATVAENRWWWDVLARGRDSAWADVFDVDWEAQGGRVLLPVLGRPLVEALGAGELALAEGTDGPELSYYDQRFPLAPGSLADGATDLARVLERQHYRLASWRLSRRQSNYRRFFDVDGLVGVRVEDEAVYRRTHRFVLDLAADPRVAGVRVDHIDGLADPAAYLARLRADLDERRSDRAVLLVEKIVARHEPLVRRWATDGMSGYEFADLATGLLVDGPGAAQLDGPGVDPEAHQAAVAELEVEGRRTVLGALFPAQIRRLAELALDALDQETAGLDLDRDDVAEALGALAAHVDVYRTYVDPSGGSPADRRRLAAAAEAATADLGPEGRRALGRLVPLLGGQGLDGRPDDRRWEVVRRWQQLTGAVAAKGVEDTALYRLDGLLAQAEVGADAGEPAVSPAAFHQALVGRARRTPAALNATTTHDTKRSEDVRARLAVLSEVPELWASLLGRWQRAHRPPVRAAGPDAHDERLVYQSLVGVWPLERRDRRGLTARMADYVVKAAREAKRRTSWLEPDQAYEQSLVGFTTRLLRAADGRFTADLDRLVDQIGPAGAVNALALVVLRSTAPGVPDLYQGNELWAPTLVDPDNRRPVDLGSRLEALVRLDAEVARSGRAEVAAELLESWRDGRLKLYVTRELLAARREQPRLYGRGAAVAVRTRGPGQASVVAVGRRGAGSWSIGVAPRLVTRVAGLGAMPVAEAWQTTALVLPEGAPDRYVERLSGRELVARRGSLPMAEVLSVLPVALLDAA